MRPALTMRRLSKHSVENGEAIAILFKCSKLSKYIYIEDARIDLEVEHRFFYIMRSGFCLL